MNSDQILSHIEEQARRRQQERAARLGLLDIRRADLRREAYERIFGAETRAHNLEDARAVFAETAAVERARLAGLDIRKFDGEIEELRALLLAGGVTLDEQAVMLESLALADDYAGLARNALNQLCVFVRDADAAGLRVLGITFAVGEETTAVERAYAMRGAALAA